MQNLTQQLETIQTQLQLLLRINGQGRMNDDEELALLDLFFCPIPSIRNKKD